MQTPERARHWWLDPPSLLETLTELNQIPVVVKDVEIPDPKSLQHGRFTSEPCASVAQHLFRGIQIVHPEREVNNPLNLVLVTWLIPSERVGARSFDFDQLDPESLVLQNRDPELYLRQIEALGRFKS